jgi:hypothetical protein
MAAIVQTLRGRRVFTGTPNAKLLMAISLSLCLIEQQTLKVSRSSNLDKIFTSLFMLC